MTIKELYEKAKSEKKENQDLYLNIIDRKNYTISQIELNESNISSKTYCTFICVEI